MRKLAIGAAVLALSGCMTVGNKPITEPSNFVTLKAGTTMKEDVFGKFGQPHDVFDFGEKKTWRYISSKTSPEPITFTLGVLIWPLIVLNQTDHDITQIDFQFGVDGKLADVSTRKGEKRKGLLSISDSFSDEQKTAVERVHVEMDQCKLPFDENEAKKSLAYLAL